MSTEASQLSVAVTSVPVTAAAGTLLHCTVTLAGTPASTGAVVSCTVITCEPVEALPQLSVAVHVRVKVYESGQVPSVRTSANTMSTDESQLSVAVTSVPITAAAGTLLHCTVTLAGIPASTGTVVSCTVITCVPVEALPQLSVAVHVRVRVYESGQVPSVRVSV